MRKAVPRGLCNELLKFESCRFALSMELETSQARYEAALERSKEAHRMMIQSKRELLHEQAQEAKKKERERRREVMAQIRAETDELVGKNVSKELEHVMPAPAHEMLSIAAQLAARLLSKDLGREDNSWYKIFKAVDTDQSGQIDFDEFRAMIRDKLRLKKHERSDYSLYSVRTPPRRRHPEASCQPRRTATCPFIGPPQNCPTAPPGNAEPAARAADSTRPPLPQVWKALDEDDSGCISVGEFGAFMRRGQSTLDSKTIGPSWRERLQARAAACNGM
jgi:Ca2+-binding EF-hand superfamily protein